MNPASAFSALFIDFENLYYYLANRLPQSQDPGDAVIRMIRRMQNDGPSQFGEIFIIQHAYADFEKLDDSSQSDLYLVGVETHHVLGTEHKNAADMRLCIDAMETMYTRPEIRSFTFMAGDRDYIPLIQHLRKHACQLRTAAFKDNISGDLLRIVGEPNFIDCEKLLPSEFTLIEPRKAKPVVKAAPVVEPAPRVEVRKTRFEKERPLEDLEKQAAAIMLRHFGDKPEVWVSPFLRRMREELPLLEEYERKRLISDLQTKGAVSVEKRSSETNDYSVMVINWDHPDIRSSNPS